MSAYIIFNYKITDRSRIDELTRQSQAIDKRYGAELIVGSPVRALEGDTFSHMVILGFKNFEAAQRYYYSDEHKELSVLRNEITEGWVSIVPGDAETQALVDSGYFEKKC